MKNLWSSMIGFWRQLVRRSPKRAPSEISPELELEQERRRGVRGF